MRNPTKLIVAYALPGLLALAGWALPASAEKADRDKPMNVEADRFSGEDAKQSGVFEGNVTLTQGTLHIHADKLMVRKNPEGFQYVTAFGNPVTFKQKREGADEYIEGSAARIEYQGKEEKIQLFERARLKRNQDELRGEYISYDQKSEYFQVRGTQGEAALGTGPGGRVKAVIQPKQKTPAPPAAPATSSSPDTVLKPSSAVTEPPNP